ncbi:MAG: hypothetical protein LBP79_07575, partial [Clostridiales bacterium]|nr:hypothetical protein [Clostridiales bacterium]
LSNGEIAELLKTLSNGTINITPDNVTPEAIDAWLSQIGSGILKNISIIKHKNNKTREKIFRLADKGGLRKNS